MPLDVVVVGSANLDLVATTARLPGPGETVLGTGFSEHPGGKGLNQAVAAARSGASTALIASLGDDDAGALLRSVADREGIDTSRMSGRVDAPTGRAVIVVDDHAENSIVVVPGANGEARFEGLPPGLGQATIVLAQLEVPVATVSAAFAAARASGWRTVLNPAPVPPGGLDGEFLSLCDVVVPNQHEVELLGGAERLLAGGVTTVIVTRGAAGVIVYEENGSRPWTFEAFAVAPIDTTGAGDSFCGSLAARLAAGDELPVAVRYAAAAGALATTVAGAVPSLPHATAVQALIGSSTRER